MYDGNYTRSTVTTLSTVIHLAPRDRWCWNPKKNCTKKVTEPKKGTKPSVERYPVFFLDIMDVFLGFQKNVFKNSKF